MKFLEAEERRLAYTLLYINLDKRAINHSVLQTFALLHRCSPERPPLAKYDDFVCRCAGVQGGQERSGGWRFETGDRVVSVFRGEPSGAIDFPLDIQ